MAFNAPTRTTQGTIAGPGIVLDAPLDLPEGTRVVVNVQVVEGGDNNEPVHSLTQQQLHEYALKHPAPQSWWEATDNPFEPEKPGPDAPKSETPREGGRS